MAFDAHAGLLQAGVWADLPENRSLFALQGIEGGSFGSVWADDRYSESLFSAPDEIYSKHGRQSQRQKLGPKRAVVDGDYEFLNRICFKDTIDYYTANKTQPVIAPSGAVYELVDYIDGISGMQLATFRSLNGANPVGVFVGTDPGELWDVWSDLYPDGIGLPQVKNNEKQIISAFKEIARIAKSERTLPDITGYSLGTANAQNAVLLLQDKKFTRSNTFEFDNLVCFNAVGISPNQVDKYDNSVNRASYYIAAGDLVSLAGNDYIPGQYNLVRWDTPMDSLFAYPLDIVMDKHNTAASGKFYLTSADAPKNQDGSDVISRETGEPIEAIPIREGVSIEYGLSTKELSSELFSYASTGGEDWASLNFSLGTLTSGVVPALLSTRGTTETSRTVIGAAVKAILDLANEPGWDKKLEAVVGTASRGAESVIGIMASSQRDFWDWLDSALPEELDVVLAIPEAATLIATYGAQGAAALARGTLIAASQGFTVAREIAESILAGGVVALSALLTLDAKALGESILWTGGAVFDALQKGGEGAWKALYEGGEDMVKYLEIGGQAALDALGEGIDAFADIAREAVRQVEQGIASAIDTAKSIYDDITDGITNIGNSIADFFGW